MDDCVMHIPASGPFAGVVSWLRGLSSQRRFGIMCDPDGTEFIVMRPAQLAELDLILADPILMGAIEAGAADVQHGRTRTVGDGQPLSRAINVASELLSQPQAAAAVERGVDDVIHGRVRTLGPGQSLRDLR